MSEWPPYTRPFRASPPDGAVGIVLPIRDDVRFFKLAYHALLSFTDYRFMLTIVDNMSSMSTCQYLESIRKNHNVNILHHQKDNSLGSIWNLGMKFMFSYATVRYGVVLTPTMIVEPYWLSSLVRAIARPDQFYAPASNVGTTHALGFLRDAYEKANGFSETADPVLDIAQRAPLVPLHKVYVHKFKVNGFDPRRTDSERQEKQEAHHVRA